MATGGKQTRVQGGELPAQPSLEEIDQRVAQLQRALDTRIVIEQAKGVLSERFRITIDQAFEILRGTARSNRQPLRQLAQQIVEHPETPGEIIRTLAQEGSLDFDLHERAQQAQLHAARRNSERLCDDAQALKAQANVQGGRAQRNLKKGPA